MKKTVNVKKCRKANDDIKTEKKTLHTIKKLLPLIVGCNLQYLPLSIPSHHTHLGIIIWYKVIVRANILMDFCVRQAIVTLYAIFHSLFTMTQWSKSYDLPYFMGFPDGSNSKESACNGREMGSIPGLGRPPRKAMAIHPVFLPVDPHGQRNLAGNSPWGCKRVGHN